MESCTHAVCCIVGVVWLASLCVLIYHALHSKLIGCLHSEDSSSSTNELCGLCLSRLIAHYFFLSSASAISIIQPLLASESKVQGKNKGRTCFICVYTSGVPYLHKAGHSLMKACLNNLLLVFSTCNKFNGEVWKTRNMVQCKVPLIILHSLLHAGCLLFP